MLLSTDDVPPLFVLLPIFPSSAFAPFFIVNSPVGFLISHVSFSTEIVSLNNVNTTERRDFSLEIFSADQIEHFPLRILLVDEY